MKKLSIYKDYRDFLKDFYAESKKENPRFTYSSFAKKAGLGSPNYLKLIMDGDRNLTTHHIQTFAAAMDLTPLEINFFEALVLENQAKGAREKRYYAQKATSFRALLKNIAPAQVQRKKPTDVLESSLKIALMLFARGLTAEELISKMELEFQLPRAQSIPMIDSLLSNGELTLNAENKLSLATPHTVMSEEKSMNLKLRNFLKEGLDDACSVFHDRYAKGTAKFLSLMISAPEESLVDLFRDLRLAVEDVVQKYDPVPNASKAVYRVQLQTYRYRKAAL